MATADGKSPRRGRRRAAAGSARAARLLLALAALFAPLPAVPAAAALAPRIPPSASLSLFLALLLTAFPGPSAAQTCTGGRVACFGSCVFTSTDRTNCGSCGVTCGSGQSCSGGSCRLACPAGQTDCFGRCVATATDEQNCGSCGIVCGSGLTCSGGSCSLSCPSGQANCGGTCTSLSTTSNCGSCGAACGSGQRCTGGRCETVDPCAGISCGTFSSCSGGACSCTPGYVSDAGGRDCYLRDPCAGVSCGSFSSCSGGTCRCNSGYVSDGGTGRNCYLPDPCAGVSCGSFSSCSGGTCSCSAGYVSDSGGRNCYLPDPCGGVDCGSFSSCSGGACRCNEGYVSDSGGRNCYLRDPCSGVDCGSFSSCSGGTCACNAGYVSDLGGRNCYLRDPCAGVDCGSFSSCSGGTCSCAPGYVSDSGGRNCYLRDPCTGIDCGSFSACSGGTCRCNPGYVSDGGSGRNCYAPDPCSGVDCGSFSSCTNGICTCNSGYVSEGGNGRNCVAADPCRAVSCPSDRWCVGGTCVCAAGLAACGDSGCVSLSSDARHCGSCSNACPAGQSCSSGACTCTGGLASCGGACVSLATDRAHCGSCGSPCPADATGCEGGSCAFRPSCAAGQTNCGSAGALDCATLDSDIRNCGACGRACPNGQICSGGQCACPGGLSACAGGCVALSSDAANCGSCGAACPEGRSCVGGTCSVVCGAGTAECGGQCVNLASNPFHCGTCSNACPAGSDCSGGTCVLVCGAGTANCGGACVDTSSSASHCGSCGTVCPAGHACVGGTCQPARLSCAQGSAECGGSCVSLSTAENCGACGAVCAGDCTGGVCVPRAVSSPAAPTQTLRTSTKTVVSTLPAVAASTSTSASRSASPSPTATDSSAAIFAALPSRASLPSGAQPIPVTTPAAYHIRSSARGVACQSSGCTLDPSASGRYHLVCAGGSDPSCGVVTLEKAEDRRHCLVARGTSVVEAVCPPIAVPSRLRRSDGAVDADRHELEARQAQLNYPYWTMFIAPGNVTKLVNANVGHTAGCLLASPPPSSVAIGPCNDSLSDAWSLMAAEPEPVAQGPSAGLIAGVVVGVVAAGAAVGGAVFVLVRRGKAAKELAPVAQPEMVKTDGGDGFDEKRLWSAADSFQDPDLPDMVSRVSSNPASFANSADALFAKLDGSAYVDSSTGSLAVPTLKAVVPVPAIPISASQDVSAEGSDTAAVLQVDGTPAVDEVSDSLHMPPAEERLALSTERPGTILPAPGSELSMPLSDALPDITRDVPVAGSEDPTSDVSTDPFVVHRVFCLYNRAGEDRKTVQVEVLATAIQAFRAGRADEVSLEVGDKVYLQVAFSDGWGVGTNMSSGKFGCFPADFLNLGLPPPVRADERDDSSSIRPRTADSRSGAALSRETPRSASAFEASTDSFPPLSDSVVSSAPAANLTAPKLLPLPPRVVSRKPADSAAGSPTSPLSPSSFGFSLTKLLVSESDVVIDRTKRLGEGGFGVVYVGLLRGHMRVAVKTIKGELDDKMMNAFVKEVQNWEGLVQRNVLPLMAFCVSPPMMVMDLIKGGNLRQYLGKRKWDQPTGRRLLLDVANGMLYLHSMGILHGDLKSLNVLVDGSRAVITDFGLSKVRREVSKQSEVGKGLGGTPGFISPQVLSGEQLQPADDVYAFAMVCYEVVSRGRYPFDEVANAAAIIYRVAIERKRPSRPDKVPDAVWDLITRCWAHEPEDRPSFAAVRDELEKLV
ncbi:hypothetical protein DFJ74DRAFT_713080 [Hyaloraphidium curvatum]|nr:hypothetical protein DFJ74DRAFT_713080 [Hyaloraphidium curvatum]